MGGEHRGHVTRRTNGGSDPVNVQISTAAGDLNEVHRRRGGNVRPFKHAAAGAGVQTKFHGNFLKI